MNGQINPITNFWQSIGLVVLAIGGGRYFNVLRIMRV